MDKKELKEDGSPGVVSFIFGVLSLIFAVGVILGAPAGIFLSILGIIFSIVQFRRGKNTWAIWGLIFSIIGLIINTIILIWIIQLINNYIIPSFQQAIQQAQQLQQLGYAK